MIDFIFGTAIQTVFGIYHPSSPRYFIQLNRFSLIVNRGCMLADPERDLVSHPFWCQSKGGVTVLPKRCACWADAETG
jgi:hypothetical protein